MTIFVAFHEIKTGFGAGFLNSPVVGDDYILSFILSHYFFITEKTLHNENVWCSCV